MKTGRPHKNPSVDEIEAVRKLRAEGTSWEKVLRETQLTPYRLRRIRQIIDPEGFRFYKDGRAKIVETMRHLSQQGATYEDLAKALPGYSLSQLRDLAGAYSLTFGGNRRVPISREQMYDLVVRKRMYERDIAETMHTTVKWVRRLKEQYGIYMPSTRGTADEGPRTPFFDSRRSAALTSARKQEEDLAAQLPDAVGTDAFADLWDRVKALRVKIAALESEYDKECCYNRLSFHQDAI